MGDAELVIDPDELFTCKKWACTLALKHCIRRQKETVQYPKSKVAKPTFEYCATGECEQGKGNAIRLVGVEIEANIKKRSPPRLDIVQAAESALTERTVMPRGKRDAPWECCGSKSNRHLMSCAEFGKKKAAKVMKKEIGRGVTPTIPDLVTKMRHDTLPMRIKPAQRVDTGFVSMSVDQIVKTIEDCKHELLRRQNAAREELANIEKALNGENNG